MTQNVFPNNIKTFVDKVDLTSKVYAKDINEAYAEIIAIQKMLLDIPIAIGTNNNYIITCNSDYTSYQDNIKITFKANMTNTGPSTINVNDLGPIPLLKGLATELEPNEIVSGKYITIICSNNTFILQDSITIENLITKFSNINHIHTQYAQSIHEHTEYVKTEDANNNYAPIEHTHVEYAPIDHTHSETGIDVVYSDALPLDDGEPSSGIIDKAAREDHVHPISTEINPLDIDETSTNLVIQLGHTHKITFPEIELASDTQNGLMSKEHFTKVEAMQTNSGIDKDLRYSLALGGLIY